MRAEAADIWPCSSGMKFRPETTSRDFPAGREESALSCSLIGRRDYDITEIDITESDVAEFDITENDITESDITETNIT